MLYPFFLFPRVRSVTGRRKPAGRKLELERLEDRCTPTGLPAGTRGWEVLPNVIRDDGVDSFQVEVDTNGPVARVIMDNIFFNLIPPGPSPIELRDDGLGGDRVAGDLVFTAGPFRWNTAFPMPAFYTSDPASPAGLHILSVGRVVVTETDGTTTNEFLLRPSVGILRSGIQLTPTVTLAPDVVVSPHLINVRTDYRATQRVLHVSGPNFVPTLTQRIYQLLPDTFDNFMLLSTNKVERVPFLTSSNFNAGIHYNVQVNYTGTGMTPFNNAASHGSAGRLLGINALDTYDRGISSNNATHELLHQWGAYTSTSLGLNDGSAHYDPRSSVGSLIGGFEWIDNGDGTFDINCDEGRSGAHHASPLDRYLMGLIDGSEVPTMRVYSSASPPPITRCMNNDPVRADEIVRTVTAADIQAVHGVRTPGPATAQRDFALAFVAESHDRLLTPTEMTFYELLADHYTRQVPAVIPDPLMSFNWAPITRFFGGGTTWRSDILPDTLRPQELTPIGAGFMARFNRPINPAGLNLYDTQAGNLGPPDVTLVGATTGTVRGSLVVDPTFEQITFLATGGPLPPDTYTVTLRSAANGFVGTAGELLDGNSDLMPGGDFTTTFTVAASAARVVSIPDFARGPGQLVNLPAASTGLPLRLSNGAGINRVTLTVQYNPALLTITGATRGPGAPLDATVTLNTSTPGQASLNYSSSTIPGTGPIDFVLLTASVPDTAPYGSKQVLDLTSVRINNATIPGSDDDGLHVVGYFGDTTGNAGYSTTDAMRTSRVVVGLDSGFAAYRLADPVIIADITGNGSLNSLDATRLLQEVIGLDRLEIPPIPPGIPPIIQGGPDPLLSIPRNFHGRPGDLLTVPINLDVSDGLESVDLALSYDASRLEVVDVRRGSLTAEFDLFLVNLDRAGRHAGTIRAGLGRTAGPITGQGGGSVLEIVFRIRPEAPAGKAVINLRQGLGVMTTQLNEGGLDLNPDPSDRAGDRLDGLVSVLGPIRWRQRLDGRAAAAGSPMADLVDAVLVSRGGRRGKVFK